MAENDRTSAEPATGSSDAPAPAESRPLRVLSFESRRSVEMKSLIERRGHTATVAPSMREVPLDANQEALEFADRLLAGEIDIMVLMTGVGTRALRDVVEIRHDSQKFLDALASCTVVVRGPKPAAVLREWSVAIDRRAEDPHTWREVLVAVEAEESLYGRKIAVQEYGAPSQELYDELTRRGADVIPVPVYRWAMPDDVEPLKSAIRETIAGRFDVLLFTSAQQLRNTLEVADGMELRDEWIAAANGCRIASIGPTASETLSEYGLRVDVEASPPKMGQLVKQALAEAE
jgi:uroporphyrinogen-III synthase